MRFWLLLLAAATPCAAQEWAFPHRPHLERGLVCETCHAARTSESATDDLVPKAQLCSVCHDGTRAPTIDTTPLEERELAERTYRFDHAFHLEQGEIAPLIAEAIDSGDYYGKPGDIRRFLDSATGCTACHRGLEESVRVEPGLHLPRMGDCIVCHTRVDNPFSCRECHIEGVNLVPADHTREFAELHSTGRMELDKQTCLPCHGRGFGCMGCH